MLKPGSLRDQLTAAIPQLKTDPSKLSILIKSGVLSTRLTTSLAFAYNYPLQVLLLDYSGHPHAVTLPIVMWVRQHQLDLLDNPDRQTKAVRFEADFLTATTVDLAIELDLTENVFTRPRPGVGGGMDVIHKAEPVHPSVQPFSEEWSLWFRDELLAQWNHDPRP